MLRAAKRSPIKSQPKVKEPEPESDYEDLFDDTWPALPEYFWITDNWEKIMLEKYESGCTNEEIIAWIAKVRRGKFTTNMFYHWAKGVPQFKFVVECGNLYKKAWWLRQGREKLGDTRFNVPLYIRMMANLFAWRTDSSVIESVGDKVDLSKLSKEDLDMYRKLRDKLKKSIQENDGNGLEKKQGDESKQQAKSLSVFAGTGRD